ncbi:HAD family phosphatase [bacterium]|nr:MAG: HAD family phosphatase [bacterium]
MEGGLTSTCIEGLIDSWGVKCVILDLDGTLVDTLEMHVEAFLRVAKEVGIEASRALIEQNMGRTPKDILSTIVPGIQGPRLALYAQRKEDVLMGLIEDAHPLPGAVELLGRLKRSGLPMVLASSTTLRNVRKILQVAGLACYIDRMVTAEDIVVGKPDPEIFIKAVAKGGSDPRHSLVIGDSVHDIAGAMGAGCLTIAVASGKHDPEQLSALKPNLIVSNLTLLC